MVATPPPRGLEGLNNLLSGARNGSKRAPTSRFTMSRIATLSRQTSETRIELELNLDGTGQSDIDTGIGFLDHMLTAFSRHGLFDLTVRAEGDLHIDAHHTTEDIGIVLGQAFRQAIGDKRGIRRFGHAIVPMDEARTEASVDISGRPFLVWEVPVKGATLGDMDTELFEEFFRAFAFNALITLHVVRQAGQNTHHIIEVSFKAAARALRMAAEFDSRALDAIPSTKGSL